MMGDDGRVMGGGWWVVGGGWWGGEWWWWVVPGRTMRDVWYTEGIVRKTESQNMKRFHTVS